MQIIRRRNGLTHARVNSSQSETRSIPLGGGLRISLLLVWGVEKLTEKVLEILFSTETSAFETSTLDVVPTSRAICLPPLRLGIST